MRTKIITSRKWHSPAIEAFVTNDEIGAQLDVQDFLAAVVEELGNPTFVVTKASLLARLSTASDAVLKELREATAHVA